MIVRSRAPLRLGLGGGGTDVSPYCEKYGGAVLNASIALYARCSLQSRADGRVRFEALDIGETYESTATSAFELREPAIVHKAVYNRIVREFNHGVPIAICVSTSVDVPPGSGLGSSSTLVVAMVQAYKEFLNLPLGEYDLARLAYEIERFDVGLAGGRQDQYAATFGGFNFMEFYANERVIVNPLRVKRSIAAELASRLVLYYTGSSRESDNIIREQSESVVACRHDAVEAMHQAKRDAVAVKELILKSDFDGFAERLGTAWLSKKRMATGVSNAEIESAYEAAIRAGAVSGKVSGAGGGGFMIFCCDPVRRLTLAASLAKEGGRAFEFDFVKDGAWAWRVAT